MVTRRSLLKSIALTPLAAALADPTLTRAAADSLQAVTTTVGGQAVNAALAVPNAGKAPAVLLVHEWWGLNDQIKTVAAEFAREGYLALAVDLYGGKVTDNPDQARSYMQAVDSAVATDTLSAWIAWLRQHEAHNGKIGTVGWCFGGGWSLNCSLANPVDATVIYYGNVKKSAAEVASLEGPALGHFATEDEWINRDMVGGFEKSMTEAGKAFTGHWYEAKHGFANPTTARYDEQDAALAWSRTLEFFRANLG